MTGISPLSISNHSWIGGVGSQAQTPSSAVGLTECDHFNRPKNDYRFNFTRNDCTKGSFLKSLRSDPFYDTAPYLGVFNPEARLTLRKQTLFFVPEQCSRNLQCDDR